MDRVELVVLDVNETLSDMTPMAERFVAVGAPASLAATWFAATLRDGFALATLDRAARFADIATGVLRAVLPTDALTVPVDEAVQTVLQGFTSLSLHPDVAPGLAAMAEAGLRVVTMSNGAASVAEGLLERAGVAHLVEATLSVDDAGRWKPHPQAYAYALEQCGAAAANAAMVAVHPWDLAGAAAAGMRTGYVDRTGSPWPGVFPAPDVRAATLGEVGRALRAL